MGAGGEIAFQIVVAFVGISIAFIVLVIMLKKRSQNLPQSN